MKRADLKYALRSGCYCEGHRMGYAGICDRSEQCRRVQMCRDLGKAYGALEANGGKI